MRSVVIRTTVIVVVAGAGLLTAGCDPWPVPTARDHAEIDVWIGAHGDARIDTFMGGGPFDKSTMTQRAGQVARDIFAGATVHAHEEPNEGTRPYGEAHVSGAYTPGSRVTVSIDTSMALAYLQSLGYQHVAVELSGPIDESKADMRPAPTSDLSWDDVAASGPAPSGTITLFPNEGRALLVTAITFVGLLAFLFATALAVSAYLPTRRRGYAGRTRRSLWWSSAVAAGLSVVAIASGVATASDVAANELGVAGTLHGSALTAVSAVNNAGAVSIFPALFIVIVAIVRARVSVESASRSVR